MQRICVFAGSHLGIDAKYTEAAKSLGQELISRKLGLVYGGLNIGLMGILADTMLESGGEVIGVLASALFRRETIHQNLTKLCEVNSISEAKMFMASLADGFIALPGGFGTLDELFEVLTWAQFGMHNKPIGVLNVENYYTPLLRLVKHASAKGFVPTAEMAMILHDTDSTSLLERFRKYTPVPLN